MAPFDAIPEPPPADAAGGAGHGADTATKSRKFAIKLNSPGTLLALVLALGFGQSLALLVFFGGRGDDLSESHASNASDVHATAHDPEPEAAPAANSHAVDPHADDPHAATAATPNEAHEQEHPSEPAPAPEPKPVVTRVPDVLDTARDMLDRGDVSGARRIATAYLLRIDGMNAAARERASAAYAILGDAMRLDYELSLRLRGDDP